MSIMYMGSGNETPVKRKRGRPPKNNKAEAFPTYTLQFQSPGEFSLPLAESNLNQMVRIGEPDAYTPFMKVSPSTQAKRRRKSSSTAPPRLNLAPLAGASALPTPVNHTQPTTTRPAHVLAKTMENMAMITGIGMRTPPEGAARTSAAMAPLAGPQLHTDDSPGSPRTHGSRAGPLGVPFSHAPPDGARLSPALFSDGLFSFRLVVDENGHAALSAKEELLRHIDRRGERPPTFAINSSSAVSVAPSRGHARTASSSSHNLERSASSVGSSLDPVLPTLPSQHGASPGHLALVQGPLHGSGSGSGSGPRYFLPTITPTSALAAPLIVADDKYIVPQTPHRDENATPDLLAFNLTPQFNTLMYLALNINLPQHRGAMVHAVPPSFIAETGSLRQPGHAAVKGMSPAPAIDTTRLTAAGSLDEGDARQALKRVFSLRRGRR